MFCGTVHEHYFTLRRSSVHMMVSEKQVLFVTSELTRLARTSAQFHHVGAVS